MKKIKKEITRKPLNGFLFGCLLTFFIFILGIYSSRQLWSEHYLSPVKRGMTKNEVVALIGKPHTIIKNTNNSEKWDYGNWWADARIYFSSEGIVWGVEDD